MKGSIVIIDIFDELSDFFLTFLIYIFSVFVGSFEWQIHTQSWIVFFVASFICIIILRFRVMSKALRISI